MVGAANFDLVATIFGTMTPLSRVVYLLIGLAAVYQVVQWKAIQHRWAFPQAATARG